MTAAELFYRDLISSTSNRRSSYANFGGVFHGYILYNNVEECPAYTCFRDSDGNRVNNVARAIYTRSTSIEVKTYTEFIKRIHNCHNLSYIKIQGENYVAGSDLILNCSTHEILLLVVGESRAAQDFRCYINPIIFEKDSIVEKSIRTKILPELVRHCINISIERKYKLVLPITPNANDLNSNDFQEIIMQSDIL